MALSNKACEGCLRFDGHEVGTGYLVCKHPGYPNMNMVKLVVDNPPDWCLRKLEHLTLSQKGVEDGCLAGIIDHVE